MAFDPITAVLDVGGKLIDRLLPDKAANDAAKAKLVEMQVAGELQQVIGQLDINKVEAASSSMFVAGWRPYIGWISGTGLGYQFILRPIFQAVTDLFGSHIAWQSLDLQTLMTLLFTMLGMAAARSYDKTTGNSNGH